MLRPMTIGLQSPARSGSDRAARARRVIKAALLGGVSACVCAPVLAQNLPAGASVAAGDVSIASPSSNAMTITQSGSSAVVNWNSFSIGAGARVDIQQPGANARLLNRVTGDTTTAILGTLSANGQVHIVNPNGIFIGPNGAVNAGGFVASTLSISDDDFLAGRLKFRGNGSSATVTNQGRVSIGRGGYAALLGGRIKNDGIVTVPLGRIGFASGEAVTLDVSGDQFLQVTLPTAGDEDGALIDHTGTASAQGGLIEMRAATARQAARHAVNLSGVAEARSVSMQNGTIVLGGGAGGAVTVSGRVSTRAQNTATLIETSLRPASRSDIVITGQSITLTGAEIDASHATTPGQIRIGGDFAGQGDLLRADTLQVDQNTQINSDATLSGTGGDVVLWSEDQTDFAGRISAQGGTVSGAGGFVEVSGRFALNYAGFVDTRAAAGAWGTLLLDPTNVTINSGAGANNEDAIEAALTSGNVIVSTTSALSEAGDITLNADIDWSTGTTLTLQADNDITFNGAINGPSGTLALDAQGGISTTSAGTINIGQFRISSGVWEQIGTLPSFAADNFELQGGSFLRATGGTGGAGSPYLITDVFGLQGVGSPSFLGASFQLANDIDASATSGWTGQDAGAGFQPVSFFFGTLDGDGFAVSDLFVQAVNSDGEGGFFVLPSAMFDGIGSGGLVTNFTLDNASIVGEGGALLANTNDGTIENTVVSGSVTSTGAVTGGLVATNSGIVRDSAADVDVTVTVNFGDEGLDAGGFVGINNGTIERSHAIGAVDVSNTALFNSISVGGFAGATGGFSLISNSYALGDVDVSSAADPDTSASVGGFVGRALADVTNSFSAGQVSASGTSSLNVGGFVGFLAGSPGFSGTFWDTDTSAQASDPASTPLTTAQFQDTETFLALAQADGWDFATQWAPGDTGFYPVNYSTSAVVFATPDPLTVQYGLTGEATATGQIAGGASDYVFGQTSDSLDPSAIFETLTFSDQNVGTPTFEVDTGDLTSADGINYRVIGALGDATITPAPLTITATDQIKTYGDEIELTEFSLDGELFFSDSLDEVPLSSEGAEADADVSVESPYLIEFGDILGTGLSNYDIDLVEGFLDVEPAPLTIRANDQSKAEDEEFIFDGTEFSVTGLVVEGDTVDSAALSSDGAPASADVADSPFAIIIEEFEGNGLDNYDITLVDGQLTIGQPGDSVPRPPVLIEVGLPNPIDVVDIGTMPTGTGGAVETAGEVLGISDGFVIAAGSCGQSSGDVSRYLACLADALNDFASELDEISTDLPPGLQNVAQIIQAARVDIDRARSKAERRLATATTDAERAAIRRDAINESRTALATASGEIRKAIALVRVEDPELASLQRATIVTVADAVDTVGIQLSRAVGL